MLAGIISHLVSGGLAVAALGVRGGRAVVAYCTSDYGTSDKEAESYQGLEQFLDSLASAAGQSPAQEPPLPHRMPQHEDANPKVPKFGRVAHANVYKAVVLSPKRAPFLGSKSLLANNYTRSLFGHHQVRFSLQKPHRALRTFSGHSEHTLPSLAAERLQAPNLGNEYTEPGTLFHDSEHALISHAAEKLQALDLGADDFAENGTLFHDAEHALISHAAEKLQALDLGADDFAENGKPCQGSADAQLDHVAEQLDALNLGADDSAGNGTCHGPQGELLADLIRRFQALTLGEDASSEHGKRHAAVPAQDKYSLVLDWARLAAEGAIAAAAADEMLVDHITDEPVGAPAAVPTSNVADMDIDFSSDSEAHGGGKSTSAAPPRNVDDMDVDFSGDSEACGSGMSTLSDPPMAMELDAEPIFQETMSAAVGYRTPQPEIDIDDDEDEEDEDEGDTDTTSDTGESTLQNALAILQIDDKADFDEIMSEDVEFPTLQQEMEVDYNNEEVGCPTLQKEMEVDHNEEDVGYPTLQQEMEVDCGDESAGSTYDSELSALVDKLDNARLDEVIMEDAGHPTLRQEMEVDCSEGSAVSICDSDMSALVDTLGNARIDEVVMEDAGRLTPRPAIFLSDVRAAFAAAARSKRLLSPKTTKSTCSKIVKWKKSKGKAAKSTKAAKTAKPAYITA